MKRKSGGLSGWLIGAGFLLVLALFAGFNLGGGNVDQTASGRTLTILSGSENRPLVPLIQAWGQENGVDVRMTFQGSVDISRALNDGTAIPFDAVWPAHSLWIGLGDTQKVTRHAASIMRTPVVLGIRSETAQRLGWVGRTDVTVQDIAAAAAAGDFRLAMTSASQSNSGASAYLGFLYAFAGNPDVLTLDNLKDPAVQENVRDILGRVDRSSGSSDWLKESFLANPEAYDAMFNYEALVIEANRALVPAGQNPLYVVYPANGLMVADSPLAFIDKGDPEKEKDFLDLQKFLLSPDTQSQLSDLGRRTGLIGLDQTGGDPAVWNPDWGVIPALTVASVPTPTPEVVAEALRLYQTELRKPSLTIWLIDTSGSMEGAPMNEAKEALRMILDPAEAATSLLQPSENDITVIIPFSSAPGTPMMAEGNDPAILSRLLDQVMALQADGGTDMYSALGVALKQMQGFASKGTLVDYLPAVVVLTDGASDTGYRDRVFSAMAASGLGFPVHAIAFGESDLEQLDALAAATVGKVFGVDKGLSTALRDVRGYN